MTRRLSWTLLYMVRKRKSEPTEFLKIHELQNYLVKPTLVRLCMRAGYFMPCSRVAAAIREIQSWWIKGTTHRINYTEANWFLILHTPISCNIKSKEKKWTTSCYTAKFCWEVHSSGLTQPENTLQKLLRNSSMIRTKSPKCWSDFKFSQFNQNKSASPVNTGLCKARQQTEYGAELRF